MMKSDPEGCGGKEYNIIGIQTDREMYRCRRILALRTELRLADSNFNFLVTNRTQRAQEKETPLHIYANHPLELTHRRSQFQNTSPVNQISFANERLGFIFSQ